MKKTFLLLFVLCTSIAFAQDISGSWTGTLSIQGTELPLVFHFKNTNTGYSATMDSPKQGAKDIPVDEVKFIDKKLTVTLKSVGVSYTGEWINNAEIRGTFVQGSFSAPMHLSKGAVEIIKPQEPKKPYPYYTENVQFTNAKENIALAGTLSLPAKEGNFPAVILISGSGQQNRDSEIMGHKPFLIIADYLTRNGFAVLRYDDRGVGESKGDPTLSTSANFANDARAAIEFLRTRKEINSKKIGVIGHSEGGMIAPMLAATDKNIAFIVLLAGTGVAGDVLLVDQNYEVGRMRGMTEDQLENAKIENQKIYNLIKADENLAEVKKSLAAYFQSNIDKIPEAERPSQEEVDTTIKQEVDAIATPWLRYFITYNPKENLMKVKCPVLVLNGDRDIQVTAALNTNGIANALRESGNKKVTLQVFPGLNHLFQKCSTCTIEEYGHLDETFSTEVLQSMTNWLKIQSK